MKLFDLDDLPPVYLNERMRYLKASIEKLGVEEARRRGKNKFYVHPLRDCSEPGTFITSLFNWRMLEARFHALKVRHQCYNDALWDALKQIWHAHAQVPVWVPLPEGVHTLVYEGCGTSTVETQQILDRCIAQPQRRGYITSHEETQSILRLKERERTFSRRRNAYMRAFRNAVEFRLTPFIQSELGRKDSEMYNKSATFILLNHGREYTVHSDREGRISWSHEHQIFIQRVP